MILMTCGDVYHHGFKYRGLGNTEKYAIQTLQGGKIRRDCLGEVSLVLRLKLFRRSGGAESQFCRHRELLRDFRQGCNTLSFGFRKMSNWEKTSSLGRRISGQKPFFKEAGTPSHAGARPDYRDINLGVLDKDEEGGEAAEEVRRALSACLPGSVTWPSLSAQEQSEKEVVEGGAVWGGFVKEERGRHPLSEPHPPLSPPNLLGQSIALQDYSSTRPPPTPNTDTGAGRSLAN